MRFKNYCQVTGAQEVIISIWTFSTLFRKFANFGLMPG